VTYNRVEKYCKELGISVLYVESNQAQTAVAHEFRRRGIIVKEIASTVAKHVRIQNEVKMNWDCIRFSRAVDQDYLQQVLLYSELARHDDAPDSLAGLIRRSVPGKAPLKNDTAGRKLLRRCDARRTARRERHTVSSTETPVSTAYRIHDRPRHLARQARGLNPLVRAMPAREMRLWYMASGFIQNIVDAPAETPPGMDHYPTNRTRTIRIPA
jgi:hypothetical protein